MISLPGCVRTRHDRKPHTLLDVRDQFFAWFNAGTSLVYLQDYAGAAPCMTKHSIFTPASPKISRPWRMLWYQTGPYFAYYYAGRFQDVISLADQTLEAYERTHP